jgi:mRNA interferase HigB
MNVIKRKPLQMFAEEHPDAARPLEQWYRTFKHGKWESLEELRLVYPHADLVTVASGRAVTVFNIGGNKYRLVVAIHYNRQRAHVLRVMTHAEYSRNRWKRTL